MAELEKAMFWHKEKKKIRCELCARRCLIGRNQVGFCNVRKNIKGELYSLNYGKVAALAVDPIEKKPLFHFFPGSLTLSYACFGCNFRCDFCCNWQITQQEPPEDFIREMEPEDIIKMAHKKGCRIISHTYAEPTVFFEFAYKVARLAHRENIYNVFVTNGYMGKEAVKKISKYLDAVTIDFKASGNPEFYKKFMSVPDVSPIFRSIKQFKKYRVFIEITNLIVPKVGDDLVQCRKLAEWVATEVGPEVPFHVIAFYPSFRLLDLPSTPVLTLERLAHESRLAGLRYVYIGNVPGHPEENTYCYNCRELLIVRHGTRVEKIRMVKDRCPTCGFKINIIREEEE